MRKQETIRKLQTATREEKIVMFADKLSNLRCMVADYMREGEVFWERFHQKDPAQQIRYYSGMMPAFEMLFGEIGASPLFGEYMRYLRTLQLWVREYCDFGKHDPNALEVLATPNEKKWVFREKKTGELFVMTEEAFQTVLSEIGEQ